MSRGYGALQQRLLQVLTEQGRTLWTLELTCRAFDLIPKDFAEGHEYQSSKVRREVERLSNEGVLTDAHQASARRALLRLEKDGAVVHLRRARQSRWGTPETAQQFIDEVGAKYGEKYAPTPRSPNWRSGFGPKAA